MAPPDPIVYSVYLSAVRDSLFIGAELGLTATALDDRGRVVGPITWTSSVPTVATVVEGRVTALKPGHAIMYARFADAKDSAFIRVLEPINRVRLARDTLMIPLGFSRGIDVTMIGASGDTLTGRAVTWSSSDTSVALVTQGLIYSNQPEPPASWR